MKNESIDFGILNAQVPARRKTLDTNDGFYGWLITNKGVSEGWARNLTYYLGAILREAPDPYLDEAKANELVRKILTSTRSKSSKRGHLVALESYMNYLGVPMKIKKPHDTLRCPVYLDQEQMGRLIRASRSYKEMAILTFFCATGCRLMELVSIDVGDLDFARRNIRIRHAKMDRQREVPMSDQLERVLKMYLSTISSDLRKPSDPLFRSIRGERVSPRAVHKLVKRVAERARLPNVHPHVLRHSFATAWVDNGGDPFHLQDLLGHSDISMTNRYWHLNTNGKKEAFKKAAPKL